MLDSCLTCDTIAEHAAQGLQGASLARVESHLASCAACRELLAVASEVDPVGARPRGAESTPQRYALLELVGVGAMGRVYRAYDTQLRREVAFKRINGRDVGAHGDVGQRRLLLEAQAMAKLSHPNVVGVFDVGLEPGELFVTMEYIDGTTVRDWLGTASRGARQVLKVFAAAGRGLAAAHRAGLVHRDFKPSNVLLGHDGRVCVADFGLVRGLDRETERAANPPDLTSSWAAIGSSTATGVVMGTPAYMAPEQHGGIRVDTRSDQYSFCVALFEALYGGVPHSGDGATARETKRAAVVAGPRRGVPRRVRVALERGLSPQPTDRFETMDALLSALEGPADWGRRRWRTLALMGIPLGVGVGVMWGMAGGGDDVCRPAAAAKRQWSDDRRQRVQQAFEQAEPQYIRDGWMRVDAELGRYTGELAHQYQGVCDAVDVFDAPDQELDRQRMMCLGERTRRVRALVDAFERPGASALQTAVEDVFALPSPAACSDLAALAQRVPPPRDPRVAVEVEELRDRLVRYRDVELESDVEQSAEALEGIVADAQRLGYAPLIAEAHRARGHLEAKWGEFADAEAAYRTAFDIALAGEDAALAGEVARNLFGLMTKRARVDEAEVWGRAAYTQLARSRAGPVAHARLLMELGIAADGANRLEAAEANYRQALELIEGELAPDHPLRVVGSINLAQTLAEQVPPEDAPALLEQSLADAQTLYGDAHPTVAHLLLTLGRFYGEAGDYEAQSANCRRADDILVAGPPKKRVTALLCLAGSSRSMDQLPEALSFAFEALDITEAAFGPQHPWAARIHGFVAGTFHMSGDDERALRHYRQTLAIIEQLDHDSYGFGLVVANLAAILIETPQGMAELRPLLERALSQSTEGQGVESRSDARLRYYLSRVLWTVGDDRIRARALATQAQRTCERFRSHPEEQAMCQQIEAWASGLVTGD